MSVLIIDDAARARAAEIIKYSIGHVWTPRAGAPGPGDNPEHVAQIGTYRVVFSFTDIGSGGIVRHLSVSTGKKGKYPMPIVACEVAQLFGFTGWDGKTVDPLPKEWWFDLRKDQNCLYVGQPYSAGKATRQ